MFTKLFNKLKMKKNFNLSKVASRAAIKDIMKTNSLRTISIANYNRYKGLPEGDVYSVKVDIQDGYINLYGSTNGRTSNVPFDDESVPSTVYENVYETVKNILAEEHTIPYSVKRNILVKVGR